MRGLHQPQVIETVAREREASVEIGFAIDRFACLAIVRSLQSCSERRLRAAGIQQQVHGRDHGATCTHFAINYNAIVSLVGFGCCSVSIRTASATPTMITTKWCVLQRILSGHGALQNQWRKGCRSCNSIQCNGAD